MITIIQNNSTSRVVGLTYQQLATLRFSVCHFDYKTYLRTKNRYKATRFVIDEEGRFPSGLVKHVLNHFNSKGIPCNVADNRIKPKYKKLNLVDRLSEPPLYPEQDIAASAIVNSEMGICEMPTGIGKTRTIKEAILRTQRPTLVITPSSNLRTQTYEYLAASFGTDDVGLLKVSHDKPIIVTNYHSLSSRSSDFYKQYPQLIFDEFHNAAAEGVRDDFANVLMEVYYRYGLTATNFKNDEASSIYLESILSEVLYSVTTREAIAKGYIKPLVPFFYDLDNSPLSSNGDYRQDVKNFIDNNNERNQFIINNAKKMIQSNIPTLILVDHVEHGRKLQSALGKDALFLNGQDENSLYNMQAVREFNNLQHPCLIGTSVLGEGVDTKACGAIFNTGGGKAKSELMQRCGRAIRNFPNKKCGYYFDFNDNRSRFLEKHSRIRAKTIEEVYGTKINYLNR